MFLESLRIRGIGPFDDVELSFVEASGEARRMTVIHGDGGTGKSTLIGAIDATRPGRAVKGALFRNAQEGARVAAAWRLAEEDPERPHPLWVVTPGQSLDGLDEDAERLRRREQAFFDKQAQGPTGFLVFEFSEHRCFPRASTSLADPARSMLRHDLRPPSYSDRTRYELTRRCKRVLAYAELSSALMGDATLVGAEGESRLDPRRLHGALLPALEGVLDLVGHRYAGLDPMSFEPLFETPDGRLCHLDEIAKQARQLIAFVVLTAHVAWVRSGGKDPRDAPAVVLVDEVELGLQPRVASGVLDALQAALPNAQWIVSTSSPVVAASVPAAALLTVRRLPGRGTVELYTAELARTH